MFVADGQGPLRRIENEACSPRGPEVLHHCLIRSMIGMIRGDASDADAAQGPVSVTHHDRDRVASHGNRTRWLALSLALGLTSTTPRVGRVDGGGCEDAACEATR